MTTRGILTYALTFRLLALSGQAGMPELMDHKPIAELVTALKSSGHARIAQGSQDIVARDASSGELFTARAPLMLTTNKQTGEWTISVFNNKEVGSVLLVGTGLQRVSPGDATSLPTFSRERAIALKPQLEGWGPAYYADEIARYAQERFRRLFTGRIVAMGEPSLRDVIKPVFFDLIFRENDAGFAVLIVDQYGTCAKIAFGGDFSDKP